MASKFLEIMEVRKQALTKGKTKEAQSLMEKAQKLAREGKVSPEEFTASRYL